MGTKDGTLSVTNNQSGFSMTMREQVTLGFSAANDILGIFNAMNGYDPSAFGYDFQATMNNLNADIIKQEASSIFDYYGRQENIVREEGKRQRGQQVVAMGASGFDVRSKTYRDMLTQTDMNIENNTAYIREEAMSKYASSMYQAKQQEIQAGLNRDAARISRSYTKSMSRMNAVLSGVSAAAKIGAISYFGER